MYRTTQKLQHRDPSQISRTNQPKFTKGYNSHPAIPTRWSSTQHSIFVQLILLSLSICYLSPPLPPPSHLLHWTNAQSKQTNVDELVAETKWKEEKKLTYERSFLLLRRRAGPLGRPLLFLLFLLINIHVDDAVVILGGLSAGRGRGWRRAPWREQISQAQSQQSRETSISVWLLLNSIYSTPVTNAKQLTLTWDAGQRQAERSEQIE